MSVFVSLFLFHKPATELNNEGSPVTGQDLRDLADHLHSRLVQAGGYVDKLTADGWSCQTTLYNIDFDHPNIHTAQQAEQRLRELGIDPDEFSIVEDELEEVADEQEDEA